MYGLDDDGKHLLQNLSKKKTQKHFKIVQSRLKFPVVIHQISITSFILI